MRRLACVMLLTIAGAGCATARLGPAASPAVPHGAGLLLVYLEPLPREADGLSAELRSVAAVGADGTTVPLELELPVLDGSAPRRERLLAQGAVPAGSYAAIELSVASAHLGAVAGGAELSVPGDARRVALTFTVADQRALALKVGLPRDVPVVRDHAFEPAFAASIPRATELAPSATAVATLGRSAVLVVFDKLTGQVFEALRTADGPRGVAYDPQRQRAYVACSDADAIESFDLARGEREQSFPLLLGDRPAGLALSRDGLTLVVANAGSNTVTVLDTPALAERFRVTVGREPVAVVFDPSGARVFVLQAGNDSLAVLDVGRGVPVGSIVLENGPVFGALDPSGRLLYVIHRYSPFLAVVDVGALAVTSRHYVGAGAQALAVDPRSGRLILSRAGIGRLEVFDPSSLLPVETLDAGGDAAYLAVDAETQQLLAAVPAARQVRILRLTGGSAGFATDVGNEPVWIDAAGRARAGP